MITIINRVRHNFTMVPNYLLLDCRISWKAKGLLCFLMSKPDNWTGTITKMASMASDGTTSVKTGLQELEKADYLRRYQVKDASGRFENFIYEIILPGSGEIREVQDFLPADNLPADNLSAVYSPPVSPLPSSSPPPIIPLRGNPDKTLHTNTPPYPPRGAVGAGYSKAFDEFWKAYPRKMGKGLAWASWKKWSLDTIAAVVMEGLAKWDICEQWHKDRGQFILLPATWLNQRRWEDEPNSVERLNDLRLETALASAPVETPKRETLHIETADGGSRLVFRDELDAEMAIEDEKRRQMELSNA